MENIINNIFISKIKIKTIKSEINKNIYENIPKTNTEKIALTNDEIKLDQTIEDTDEYTEKIRMISPII